MTSPTKSSDCNKAVFPQPRMNVSAGWWHLWRTSKDTITWLDAKIKHYIPPEDWPPNSPDLSSIENFWSVMTTAVYADPEHQSL